MESLEKQILTLSQKVNAIYEVIERLDMRLSQALSDSSLDKLPVVEHYLEKKQPLHELKHKDILLDGMAEMSYQTTDRQITPEIQIQRLTTQLTAAYHRIAALEEQLVKQRVY